MVTPSNRADPRVGERHDEPRHPNPRRLRFSGVGILIITLIVFAVIIVAPSFRLFVEQRQQIADLEAAVAAQHSQVDTITSERARWSDPAYLRAQARDRLYYIMPGEVSYLIVDDVRPGGQARAPVSESIQATAVDWVQSLFGSLIVSGLTAKTPDELQVGTSAPAQ